MFEILGTIASSIFAGGATGILGVIAQRIADYKNRQLDMQVEQMKQAHEVEMRKADAEIMREEWAQRTKVAEIETQGAAHVADIQAAGASDLADANAFADSFKLEPQLFSASVKPSRGQAWALVLLDVLRGCVRPILTLYLCILATVVYMKAQKYGSGMTQAEAFELTKLIIGTVLYLWVTCTLWWFGTRNKGKAPS